ncbi:hypothetical protein CWO33_05585 [Vibrio splendidus]|uniref:hypothetical protein n=1 Tax=Vibrio splendidus TaxID=29497 RepID=UPI000D3698DA|nr:hypothetical protein [Vibrio splendidus]PTQ16481.1 hypothetical protein CWO33_05585 [Vibrio splendidus]
MMKPYELSEEESLIIDSVKGNTLSPQQKWDDCRVTLMKLRIKKHYIAEQNNTCAYCQVNQHTTHGMVWDTEHIVDKDSSPQWMFEPLNLCVSCKDCNGAKGTRTCTKGKTYKNFPRKSANYRIIHPHFDDYDEHIKVAVPGAVYLYQTEKGRNTIEVCGLLRYHKAGGRNKVDLGLKAALLAAANDQSPEMLEYAFELIQKHKADIAEGIK